MNNLRFSILIANYNNGKYISDAVQSVLLQIYTNWEVIIVDDCSTDESKEVYKKFKDNPRIKIYENDINGGCGYTKHRCAELATGDLCGFLDPDDTLTPDALQVMVDEHEKHPEAAIICSRHSVCNEGMNKMWDSEVRDKNKQDYLTQRFHSVEVFAAFKRMKYNQTAGLNPAYKRAVDQDLYYLLEEQGEIVFIDNVLYNYRIHANSISDGHYKALYWHVLAIKEAAERRGIVAENVVDKVFKDLFDIQKQQIRILKESSYYRLGYLLLAPVQKVIRKCKKIIRKIF